MASLNERNNNNSFMSNDTNNNNVFVPLNSAKQDPQFPKIGQQSNSDINNIISNVGSGDNKSDKNVVVQSTVVNDSTIDDTGANKGIIGNEGAANKNVNAEDAADKVNGIASRKEAGKDNFNCASNGLHSRSILVDGKAQQRSVTTDKDKTLDEMLEAMDRINKLVKICQFTPTMASHVFKLYEFLKKNGESLEQSHKNELNQLFVSIRQAACRDSGQLGTPCRLKMMELIELRAMKWRPNLSHSQYYVDRSVTNKNCHAASEAQPTVNGAGGTTSPENQRPVSVDSAQFAAPPKSPGAHSGPPPHARPVLGGVTPLLAPLPLSNAAAPSFVPSPLSPFHPATFGHMVQQQQQRQAFHRSSLGDLGQAMGGTPSPGAPPGAPSFYLIPTAHLQSAASGATGSPGLAAFLPGGLLSGHTTGTPSPPAHTPLIHHPMAANFGVPAPFNALAFNAKQMAAKLAAMKNSASKGQFRDEVIIRNADSGKIMGVKGRRVSIIEELSGSIISFQKVAPEAKERTLTITGPSEESILHAKVLIEDTIRRNVSPVRTGTDQTMTTSLTAKRNEIFPPTNEPPPPTPIKHRSLSASMSCISSLAADVEFAAQGAADVAAAVVPSGSDDEVELPLSELGSVLKLTCSDPNVLKVARQALSDYFQKRDGASGVQMRRASCSEGPPSRRGGPFPYSSRERRKSMPLPLNILEEMVEGQTESGCQTPKYSLDTAIDNSEPQPGINESKFGNALSTPSLLAAVERRVSVKSENKTRIVYTRDYLLQCSDGILSSDNFARISFEVREMLNGVVILAAPRKFDAQQHKQKATFLKQYARF